MFRTHTLQHAIIRNLQVSARIGAQDRRLDKEAHREIDWKAIAGMRNVLVHDYFDVDFEAVGGRSYP